MNNFQRDSPNIPFDERLDVAGYHFESGNTDFFGASEYDAAVDATEAIKNQVLIVNVNTRDREMQTMEFKEWLWYLRLSQDKVDEVD